MADEPTTVSAPAWVSPACLVGLPVIGGAAGWGLTFAVDWIVGLSWFPFRGLFELYTRIPEPFGPIAAVAFGAVAGLLLGLMIVHDMLTVTVDRRSLRLQRGDFDRTIPAADVASVFVEDKRVVVLGHRRQELARVEFDLDRERLGEELRRHGYAWRPDGDPYGREFRLWVPDAAGLPAGADALLRARQRALEKVKGKDLEELRDELARLDVVVRDKDRKQYWRTSDPAQA